ncbi:MAG: hypothetical protein Fur0022_09180 [Anaerolineales bacterium]
MPANRGFYERFRRWLKATGYSLSAVQLYGTAARLALSYLNRPYWTLDPATDWPQVQGYLEAHYAKAATRAAYLKGLAKFGTYVRLDQRQSVPEKTVNWAYYLETFPAWLADEVRGYLAHCQHAWPGERRFDLTGAVLSHLTLSLRWFVAQEKLPELAALTPTLWWEYVDVRLAAEKTPRTLNGELRHVCAWLRFLAEEGRPVCARMFQVEPLTQGPHLPKDVPPEQLRRLLETVETEAHHPHAANRRLGTLDTAWVLLMLHSGLRTGEVRRLQLADLDRERRLVRIEQSKGLKDRLVPVSAATLTALQRYLEIRGPAEALPPQVFIFRHAPLTRSYCYQRLQTYGARCGVGVTPHQLRHSCATLLLNAGAPVLAVQTILGHKHVDTTLGYARLYDGTVAADYYRAMTQVERQLALPGDPAPAPPHPNELVALVDALRNGTLNDAQTDTLYALRTGLLALAERETNANNG